MPVEAENHEIPKLDSGSSNLRDNDFVEEEVENSPAKEGSKRPKRGGAERSYLTRSSYSLPLFKYVHKEARIWMRGRGTVFKVSVPPNEE